MLRAATGLLDHPMYLFLIGTYALFFVKMKIKFL